MNGSESSLRSVDLPARLLQLTRAAEAVALELAHRLPLPCLDQPVENAAPKALAGRPLGRGHAPLCSTVKWQLTWGYSLCFV